MRRVAIGLVTVALACAVGRADEITPAALGSRTFRYTYEARITPPPDSRALEVWVPLPREEDQQVLDLRVSGATPVTTVRLASGDRAAYVRVTDPKQPIVLTQTATVMRREVHAPVTANQAKPDAVDAAVHAAELASTPVIQVNDEIRRIAKEQAGNKPTVVAKARALYDWVYDHMQYDKSVPGWGLGDIPYCLKIGKGNCTDFHSLFIALARTSGIPARWNIGFPLAYGEGTPGGEAQKVQGYHCWAEFWAPGAGWVPVDISEARKHPELKDYFFGNLSGNRLLLTRGRDVSLPPDDKDPRLNFFVYPVARADGAEVKPEWTFSYVDLGTLARAGR